MSVVRLPVRERFMRHVRRTPTCWLWIGSKNTWGYGRFGMRRDGATVVLRAHRVAYILFVGPIAPRMQIDHICRRRACVRPDHLEAVTRAENIRRSSAPGMEQHRTGRCKRGHLYTDVLRNAGGHVAQCRPCRRERQRWRFHNDPVFRAHELARSHRRTARLRATPEGRSRLAAIQRRYDAKRRKQVA